MNDPASLAYRREHYRLWFEYLRLARTSSDRAVRRALEQSRAFYAVWGTDTSIKFEAWWKTHAGLFEDKHQIRVLQPGEERSDPQALVLEILLTRSATAIIQHIRPLLEEAVANCNPVASIVMKFGAAHYGGGRLRMRPKRVG